MQILLHRRTQCGAVMVTVSLLLLFLLGFMGVTLNFSRLFIVKYELQTAMDSCALAAAQELDGQNTALTRAAHAGKTAGNANNVNLKTPDITFKDAFYLNTTIAAHARYAQCRYAQSAIEIWLLHAMNRPSVMALSVATRTSDLPGSMAGSLVSVLVR